MPAIKHRSFRGKKSEQKKEKDSDIAGKTARGKEVTRGEKKKAMSDFKKMKEQNLAREMRKKKPIKAGDNIKKSGTAAPKKKFNVGVSKGGVSFREAFKHFRNKGDKTFTWNGKKYTTELKK